VNRKLEQAMTAVSSNKHICYYQPEVSQSLMTAWMTRVRFQVSHHPGAASAVYPTYNATDIEGLFLGMVRREQVPRQVDSPVDIEAFGYGLHS
jgi:hypothetical protein